MKVQGKYHCTVEYMNQDGTSGQREFQIWAFDSADAMSRVLNTYKDEIAKLYDVLSIDNVFVGK